MSDVIEESLDLESIELFVANILFCVRPVLVQCGTPAGHRSADRTVRADAGAPHDGRHRAAVSARLHLVAAQRGPTSRTLFPFCLERFRTAVHHSLTSRTGLHFGGYTTIIDGNTSCFLKTPRVFGRTCCWNCVLWCLAGAVRAKLPVAARSNTGGADVSMLARPGRGQPALARKVPRGRHRRPGTWNSGSHFLLVSNRKPTTKKTSTCLLICFAEIGPFINQC